jgi:hypothetical protein
MNCLNHPDVAAVAYCQNCGKPLCSACMRTVGGVVYCETCLAARLSSQAATGQPAQYPMHAHPVLAGLLGFIPGVGAMYNGQLRPGSSIRFLTPLRRPRPGATDYPCPIRSDSTTSEPGLG